MRGAYFVPSRHVGYDVRTYKGNNNLAVSPPLADVCRSLFPLDFLKNIY